MWWNRKVEERKHTPKLAARTEECGCEVVDLAKKLKEERLAQDPGPEQALIRRKDILFAASIEMAESFVSKTTSVVTNVTKLELDILRKAEDGKSYCVVTMATRIVDGGRAIGDRNPTPAVIVFDCLKRQDLRRKDHICYDSQELLHALAQVMSYHV